MKFFLSSVLLVGLVGCAKTERVVIQGNPGVKGDTGLSAYELAVRNGFIGSEADWLISLTGATGQNGVDGKSAYELYKELVGNENKTLTEFIDSLKGVPGVQGPAGLNGQDGAPGQSCVVSKSGSVATVVCGGSTVTINDGVNGTSGLVSTLKLCKDSSKNSQEYGLVINGSLYAVFHSERCNQGNGVPGTVDVNGLYACTLDASQNSKMSNTYLAKLTLGSSYVTTDGTGCVFTASLN